MVTAVDPQQAVELLLLCHRVCMLVSIQATEQAVKCGAPCTHGSGLTQCPSAGLQQQRLPGQGQRLEG